MKSQLIVGLLLVLLLSNCRQTFGDDLQLVVDAPKNESLIGQVIPVTIHVRNTGQKPVAGIFLLEEVSFEIQDMSKTGIVWAIPGRVMPEADYRETVINPGSEISTTVNLIYDNARQRLALPSPGKFSLRAEANIGYRIVGSAERREESARSSPLIESVRAPSGDDEKVWALLSQDYLLKAFAHPETVRHSAETSSKLQDILSEYPNSNYAKQIRSLLDK